MAENAQATPKQQHPVLTPDAVGIDPARGGSNTLVYGQLQSVWELPTSDGELLSGVTVQTWGATVKLQLETGTKEFKDLKAAHAVRGSAIWALFSQPTLFFESKVAKGFKTQGKASLISHT